MAQKFPHREIAKIEDVLGNIRLNRPDAQEAIKHLEQVLEELYTIRDDVNNRANTIERAAE